MKNVFSSILLILITGCITTQPSFPEVNIKVEEHLRDVGISTPDIQSIRCTDTNTHGNMSCSVNYILNKQKVVDLLLCNQHHGCREIPIDDKGRLILPIEECDESRQLFNK